MKKILTILALAMLMLMPSCKNKNIPYDQYELEKYNGYVVVGVMKDMVGGVDRCIFNLMKESDFQVVDVSKKTFKMYSLGDTIHCIRPNEEPVEILQSFDSIYIIEKIGNHEYIFSKYGGVCHYDDCSYCNGN